MQAQLNVLAPAYGLVQLMPVFQICRARESQRERNLKQLEEEKKQNWRSRKSRVVICLIVGGFVLGEQGSSILSTRAFYPIYVDLDFLSVASGSGVNGPWPFKLK